MKPIAAPIVGGMITSTIHVLILVPVFFIAMKERALQRGLLTPKAEMADKEVVLQENA
jgi:Cu(I)/Ag(I) efflux system membrane protein CusA/SilA